MRQGVGRQSLTVLTVLILWSRLDLREGQENHSQDVDHAGRPELTVM